MWDMSTRLLKFHGFFCGICGHERTLNLVFEEIPSLTVIRTHLHACSSFYLIFRETLLEKKHCNPPSHGPDNTRVNSSIYAVAVCFFYEGVFSYIGFQFTINIMQTLSFNPESIHNANLDLVQDQALARGRDQGRV